MGIINNNLRLDTLANHTAGGTNNSIESGSIQERIAAARGSIDNLRNLTGSKVTDKDIKQIQNEAIKFSDYKVDFFKKQDLELGKLLEKWQAVKDDGTGYATAQIATIEDQQVGIRGAHSLSTTQSDFWKDEHNVKYEKGDLGRVKSIYENIRKLEEQYKQSALGESNDSLSDIHTKLKGCKDELATIRGYETKQPAYNNPGPLREANFAKFKEGFYDKQGGGLKELAKEWGEKLKKNPNDKEAQANILKITKALVPVAAAKEFWSQDQKFLTKLGNAGFSAKNQDQIDKLTAQLSGLANDMDMALSEGKPQIPALAKQIASIQAQITKLHTGF